MNEIFEFVHDGVTYLVPFFTGNMPERLLMPNTSLLIVNEWSHEKPLTPKDFEVVELWVNSGVEYTRSTHLLLARQHNAFSAWVKMPKDHRFVMWSFPSGPARDEMQWQNATYVDTMGSFEDATGATVTSGPTGYIGFSDPQGNWWLYHEVMAELGMEPWATELEDPIVHATELYRASANALPGPNKERLFHRAVSVLLTELKAQGRYPEQYHDFMAKLLSGVEGTVGSAQICESLEKMRQSCMAYASGDAMVAVYLGLLLDYITLRYNEGDKEE